MATIRILRIDGTRIIRLTPEPLTKAQRDALRRDLDVDDSALLYDVLPTAVTGEAWAYHAPADYERRWQALCRARLPYGAGKRGEALRLVVLTIITCQSLDTAQVSMPSGTVLVLDRVRELVGEAEAARVVKEAWARMAAAREERLTIPTPAEAA
jgi:hypothetical protein